MTMYVIIIGTLNNSINLIMTTRGRGVPSQNRIHFTQWNKTIYHFFSTRYTKSAVFMLSMVPERRPFGVDFNSEHKKKSRGPRSGKKGRMIVWLLTRLANWQRWIIKRFCGDYSWLFDFEAKIWSAELHWIEKKTVSSTLILDW